MKMLNSLARSPRLAELKVSYRRRTTLRGKPPPTPSIVNSSHTAEQYLRAVWDANKLELVEELYVVCLNGAHEAIGWLCVSSGGFDRAVVDIRMVFGVALQVASSAIIVAHNHPSGHVTPSLEDRAVTAKLRAAGDVLNIPLLDHIILSRADAFSFADAGLLQVSPRAVLVAE
ncbi:MAG: JAB domain-containing protein [Planctomycetia bacterium]|nr:JAB domain-containing protein [Planctomycetia bacterium]